VGGGVVYDSDEEAEYEETLHKGRTLFGVIGGEEKK
jgi:para-aminobenzoate synthetase component 1